MLRHVFYFCPKSPTNVGTHSVQNKLDELSWSDASCSAAFNIRKGKVDVILALPTGKEPIGICIMAVVQGDDSANVRTRHSVLFR